MGIYRFEELVDLERVQELTDLLYQAAGIPVSIIDLGGKLLAGSGAQAICSTYHKAIPGMRKRCLESNKALATRVKEDMDYRIYQCGNGLIVGATPLSIGGEHVANLYAGQLLVEEPEQEYFTRQAGEFSLDEKDYLQKVGQVPVIPRSSLENFMRYFASLSGLLGEMSLQKYRLDLNEVLEESEERLRLALDATSDGMFDWDLVKEKAYYSPRWKTMLGYGPGQLEDSYDTMSRLLHPEDREGFFRQLDKCKGSGGTSPSFSLEARLRGWDGSYRWILSRGQVQFGPGGEALRITGTHTDITLQKKAAEIIESQVAQLEAKNAEMERFIYTVSHDLRSPLITIKGFLGSLVKDAKGGNFHRMESDIRRIASAADKMQGMLEDLLKLSRVGRLLNPFSGFSLGQLCREVVELLHGPLQERGVRVEIDEGLPGVFGDRTRVGEVLQNLLENGIKFMGEQQEPKIKIGYKKEAGKYIFFVEDNGIGIDAGLHKKIFGLFDQLNPNVEGSGIGLALAKRIVEFHGGEIWVESAGPGRGSTFYFTLPRERSGEYDGETGPYTAGGR